MSTNQPTDKHRAIAREIGAIVMCPDYVERSSDDCPACLRDIAAILAKHDRPATATGKPLDRIARASNHAANALQGGAPTGWQEWTWETAQDNPEWYDAWMVWNELRQIDAAAPSAEPLPSDTIDKLRDLAERAVVALHMHFHAGVNKPGFDDCRTNLCADWHDLTRREAFSNGIRPTENI